MMRGTRRLLALTGTVAVMAGLAACSSDSPLDSPSPSSSGSQDTTSITVGSANFTESEILMDVYGIALADAGLDVSYKPDIGSRETYVAAIQDGSIDLVPDYTGNLLGYLDPDATAASQDDVMAALPAALPDGLSLLDPADAEDKDSLNVTPEFAQKHDLSSISDLKALDGFSLGANAEFKERSYGVPGLKKTYGLEHISFVAINDGGGPNTVKALVDGKVDVADLYTTSPAIDANGFVTLDDPENLIASQNVIPLLATRAKTDTVTETLNAVSAQLSTADLVKMNDRVSGDEKADAKTAAKDWLTSKNLLSD